MRMLLSFALICAACVTSDTVDPYERTYDDRVAVPEGVVLTAVDERLRFPADAPVLEVVGLKFHEMYASVRSDPSGDGYFLARLDGAPMTCFDGQQRAACRTHAIDWTRARLSPGAQLHMQDAMDESTAALRVAAIARGHWVPIAPNVKYPPDGVWVLAEAWVAEPGGAAPAGQFVRINDNGIMCVVAPCAHLTEGDLYSDDTTSIHELDFSTSNLRPALIDRVVAATYRPDGAIVAGERYWECTKFGPSTGRTVTAAYLRLGVK